MVFWSQLETQLVEVEIEDCEVGNSRSFPGKICEIFILITGRVGTFSLAHMYTDEFRLLRFRHVRQLGRYFLMLSYVFFIQHWLNYMSSMTALSMSGICSDVWNRKQRFPVVFLCRTHFFPEKLPRFVYLPSKLGNLTHTQVAAMTGTNLVAENMQCVHQHSSFYSSSSVPFGSFHFSHSLFFFHCGAFSTYVHWEALADVFPNLCAPLLMSSRLLSIYAIPDVCIVCSVS